MPASGALSGASSDLAKDVGSLSSADMQFESAASECSSQDDRVYEELIKAVSRRQISDGWPRGGTSASISSLFP